MSEDAKALISLNDPSRGIGKRKTSSSLTTLNDRHHEIIRLMLYGNDGKHMTADQVAHQLRMRSAYVRSLLTDPLFRAEFDRGILAKKTALKPRAIEVLGDLIDNAEGEAVKLGAVKLALDEPGKGGVNVIVNNQVNTDVKVTPGYVIRLPAAAAPTIEHEP